MMKQHLIGLSIIFFVIFNSSCQSPTELPGTDKFTGDYAAHVRLDSTALIATEIINGLESPRNITVGPDGWLWINEIRGTVSRMNPESGEIMKLLEVPDVFFESARGLLSTALHPEFEEHPYVYLHYTYAEQETGSRITRYTFTGDTLTDRKIILDDLPGGSGHSGSKMMIGPDNKLWLATGDASQDDLAQNLDTYHGKVLRMDLDGSVPEDNPIKGSRIWTSGHRNIQGITHGNGKIYASEFGPANDDEVNLLRKGGNYGWPDVQGLCDSESERQYCRDSLIVEPLVAFNPVIAPAGIAYYGHDAIPEWKNSLLLASLRIQTLRVLRLNEDGDQVDGINIFFQQHFGRIRDVAVDSQERIFLLTSNTDWYKEYRPEIHDSLLIENRDRIIMLQKADASLLARFENVENKKTLTENRIPRYLGDSEIADDMGASEQLYVSRCASCHRPDGAGTEGYAPSLITSEWVSGNRGGLIDMMLNGIPSEAQSDNYEWDMPVFRNLNNDELAAVLNYIRSEFSSETDQFRPVDIQEVRDLTE
ncbi:MAG: PQQ-dependent sugar dehydrogenase [Balneolales bacterium]